MNNQKLYIEAGGIQTNMNKTIPRSALFVFAALLLLLLATAPAMVRADDSYWQRVVTTGDTPGPRRDSAGA